VVFWTQVELKITTRVLFGGILYGCTPLGLGGLEPC